MPEGGRCQKKKKKLGQKLIILFNYKSQYTILYKIQGCDQMYAKSFLDKLYIIH